MKNTGKIMSYLIEGFKKEIDNDRLVIVDEDFLKILEIAVADDFTTSDSSIMLCTIERKAVPKRKYFIRRFFYKITNSLKRFFEKFSSWCKSKLQ